MSAGEASAPRRPALAGIGSMVADRLHRAARCLRADEKAVLRPLAGGEAERVLTGGVMLNQLGWAAALGLPVAIFGRQGQDADGRRLRAAMDRAGIERHLRLEEEEASSFAQVFVDDDGGRAIYMAPGATATTTAEQVREHFAELVAGAGRVSTEVSQLPLEAVAEVLRIAREAGVPTALDVDLPPEDAVPALGDREALDAVLRSADLLKPSKAAAAALLERSDADALGLADALRARFDASAVVVTDGAEGCAVAAEGGVALRLPAYAVKEVADSTGAGDAFLGGLLTGLAVGFGWEDAGRLANACGAACVEQLGGFPADPERARARVLELFEAPALPLEARPPAPEPSPAASEALRALAVAVRELGALRERLAPQAFDRAVALVRRAQAGGGRVHVTGVGKAEHVAHYAAAVLASTGTPATFLHATEAVHGSLGQLVQGDVVVAISNSGETEELLRAVRAAKGLGAVVIAVTGEARSTLSALADAALDAGVAAEGGGLGLAPRASAAAALLVLAALSAALESDRGFTRAQYHARHPSGSLGERSRSGP